MDVLGEGEDAEERFGELDMLQGHTSRRRYHRGEIMLPQAQKNVDDVRRRIQAKADAERKTVATREKEERMKAARDEELRKIREMGAGGDKEDKGEEDEGGFRVKVDSSGSDDSDESSEITDSDEYDHEDSDEVFGSEA